MALIDNLVAYYKLDGNSNDSVGSNNGTDTNVSYVTGKINQSGSFNGSNSYMDLPTGIINATNSFSISFWAKINSLPTTNYGALILGKYNNSGGAWNYGIPNIGISSEGTKDITFSNRDGSGSVASGTILTSPSINTWYNITFVYDRNVGTYGTNYTYLNGSLVSTVANSRLYTNYSNPIRLAKSQDSWQLAYYNGIIDELGLWSRALSSGEVLALYNGGAGLTYPFGVAPTVTTSSVTNIATNSGLGNGNVTDDGNATITERGICWNTSPNPTTANSKSIATGTTGAFSADIHSLTTGTTYYVRAYATNSVGTSYGSEVTFSPSQVSLQQESGGFIKQENGRTFIF